MYFIYKHIFLFVLLYNIFLSSSYQFPPAKYGHNNKYSRSYVPISSTPIKPLPEHYTFEYIRDQLKHMKELKDEIIRNRLRNHELMDKIDIQDLIEKQRRKKDNELKDTHEKYNKYKLLLDNEEDEKRKKILLQLENDEENTDYLNEQEHKEEENKNNKKKKYKIQDDKINKDENTSNRTYKDIREKNKRLRDKEKLNQLDKNDTYRKYIKKELSEVRLLKDQIIQDKIKKSRLKKDNLIDYELTKLLLEEEKRQLELSSEYIEQQKIKKAKKLKMQKKEEKYDKFKLSIKKSIKKLLRKINLVIYKMLEKIFDGDKWYRVFYYIYRVTLIKIIFKKLDKAYDKAEDSIIENESGGYAFLFSSLVGAIVLLYYASTLAISSIPVAYIILLIFLSGFVLGALGSIYFIITEKGPYAKRKRSKRMALIKSLYENDEENKLDNS
ncbi:putative exported protein [Plasmodium gaboni]|uniref:Putative exported protein n=1 Tax=Plasmodium gaboni TaxID=647221 RepID=A0A151LES0_9APIC|nr:putative exported protein [Plasmodium gaboni]KYN97453.1 putative exported protein [Plasmodium gaboni]